MCIRDSVIAKQMEELERISGYTAEEAKAILLANTEKEVPVSYTHLDVYKRQPKC